MLPFAAFAGSTVDGGCRTGRTSRTGRTGRTGIAALLLQHCVYAAWQYPAYSSPERGITQRVASRSGASTGCSGLCPLPILSHTFPYFPIIYRATSRCSPCDGIPYAVYRMGLWVSFADCYFFRSLATNMESLLSRAPLIFSIPLVGSPVRGSAKLSRINSLWRRRKSAIIAEFSLSKTLHVA